MIREPLNHASQHESNNPSNNKINDNGKKSLPKQAMEEIKAE